MKSHCKIVACLLLAIGGAASADPGSPAGVERVRYADLDLTRPDGVAELNLRIARAAKRICYRSWDGSPQTEWAYHACRKDTLADARRSAEAALARSGAQAGRELSSALGGQAGR